MLKKDVRHIGCCKRLIYGLHYYCINKITNPLLLIVMWLVSINFLYLHYHKTTLWVTVYLATPEFVPHGTLHDNDTTETMTHILPHVSKIAFLYLTRDNMETPKIWDNFFENEEDKKYYNIYVHPKWTLNITKKQSYIYDNILPKRLLINDTARFQFSLVEASNTLFKYALNHDKHNQKFVLLSETHIPLYNLSTIYNKLTYNNNNFSWGLQQGSYGLETCFMDIYNHIKNHSIVKQNMTETEFEHAFVHRNVCLHTTQWIVLDRSIIINYLLRHETYWSNFYKGVNESYADEDYYSNMLVKFMTSGTEKKTIAPKGVTFYHFCENCTHASYYSNISNEWIDELRNDGYLFLRKVNESSIVDVNYLMH